MQQEGLYHRRQADYGAFSDPLHIVVSRVLMPILHFVRLLIFVLRIHAMRNRILIICTLLSLATCAHMPAPEQSEFAMPVALVRYLATHPSYMTSNSTYVYEPFSAGNSTTTKIPPELLADLAGKGIRFSQGPNMTDREARRDFDLAQLGIRAQVPRADGDYDVSYNFSVFLVGGGYYGSSGKAVMRLNAAGWRVLDTAITQFSRGNWR